MKTAHADWLGLRETARENEKKHPEDWRESSPSL